MCSSGSVWPKRLAKGRSLKSFICGVSLIVLVAVCTSNLEVGWFNSLRRHALRSRLHTENPFAGCSQEKVTQLVSVAAPPVDLDCSKLPFDYFVVIGVSSGAHHVEERQVIRDTWGQFANLVPKCAVLVRFVTGSHQNESVMARVKEEMEVHKDVIQDLSIKETYDALSAKTALFHRWCTTNVNFMYAFKTDDDTFVRIDRLVASLYELRAYPRLYWGSMSLMKFPVKEKTGQWSKWYSDFWPAAVAYPPHGKGHGFALSHDLVGLLADWQGKLDCKGLEDVCTSIHVFSDYVYEATGHKGLNIVTTPETALPLFEDIIDNYDNTQCEETMTMAIHIKDRRSVMFKYFQNYQTCGRMCSCSNDPNEVMRHIVLTSQIKRDLLARSLIREAWPYFSEDIKTKYCHKKIASLSMQLNYYTGHVQLFPL